jgi:hypothetical protein
MNDRHTSRPIAVGFERRCLKLPVGSIRPSKELPSTVKDSKKYAQIVASVKAVGLVEPIVVIPHSAEAGAYIVVDGHLRLEALHDCGIASAECLVALDDEGFTYNKRINGLAVVQEHKMIVKALDAGVPAEDMAAALGISIDTLHARFRLLDGICDEAAAILADKHCAIGAFKTLKKMKPFRQIDAATRMVDFNNYSAKFALAMLESTPPEQLAEPRPGAQKQSGSAEANARLEREVAALQVETRLYEQNYGRDNLQLMMIVTYLANLLTDARVVLWLSEHRRDYLAEFKKIADVKALPSDSSKSAN